MIVYAAKPRSSSTVPTFPKFRFIQNRFGKMLRATPFDL